MLTNVVLIRKGLLASSARSSSTWAARRTIPCSFGRRSRNLARIDVSAGDKLGSMNQNCPYRNSLNWSQIHRCSAVKVSLRLRWYSVHFSPPCRKMSTHLLLGDVHVRRDLRSLQHFVPVCICFIFTAFCSNIWSFSDQFYTYQNQGCCNAAVWCITYL